MFDEKNAANSIESTSVDDCCSKGKMQYFICHLQLGFNTELANRCLYAMCASLEPAVRLSFLSRIFCSNPWRIVDAAERVPFINEIPTDCVEMAHLFDQLFLHFNIEVSLQLPSRLLVFILL